MGRGSDQTQPSVIPLFLSRAGIGDYSLGPSPEIQVGMDIALTYHSHSWES